MTLNVAVIFGGRSVEHEISIISALQCINAINKDKYNIIPLYISKQGDWYSGKELLTLENYRNLEQLLAQVHRVITNQNAGRANFYLEPKTIFTRRKPISIDVAFPVIHGTYGEDGTLQGLLEIMNIPYVGCDVLTAAITMDKVVTKKLLRSVGIQVLDDFSFYGENWIQDKDGVIARLKQKFSYPLIVKPSNLGSSIGVSVVNNDKELEDGIDLAISLSHKVLLEPHISNLKEINCAVMGDRDAVEVSVCEEPLRSSDILSYKDKYFGGSKSKLGSKTGSGGMSSAKRKIPADVSAEVSAKIQACAKKAFVELNCNGVVRVDFLLDKNTNEIYLCELNTIPGSLAFYLWEPMGKNFTELTEQLIGLAIKRNRENNNLVVSYTDNILKG